MGIGCRRDILEANVWYVKAADLGDERAKLRLAAIRAAANGGTPMEVAPPKDKRMVRKRTPVPGGAAAAGGGATGDAAKDENCIVM